MKPVCKGDAVDLNKAAKETYARRERARSLLEHTLPWRVKVQFLGEAGEVICEWDTELKLQDWRSRVSLTFCPATDIEADE